MRQVTRYPMEERINLQRAPIAKTEMLIRKPVMEVFRAFVDPAITTKFWFTKSSGQLEEGKEVRWDWEMYGVSTRVAVKKVEKHKRILIEWDDPPTQVERLFTPRADGTTFVRITNSGFVGDGDSVVRQALTQWGDSRLCSRGLRRFLSTT